MLFGRIGTSDTIDVPDRYPFVPDKQENYPLDDWLVLVEKKPKTGTWIVNSSGGWDEVTTDEELFLIKKEQAQNAVLSAVQSVIDSYNTSHGLSFISVDSCPKYTFDQSYEHYQFCVDIISYNLICWEYIRGLQTVVLNGGDYPTEEEFYNNFPEYTGVV